MTHGMHDFVCMATSDQDGALCPIGRIEAATERALQQIAAART